MLVLSILARYKQQHIAVDNFTVCTFANKHCSFIHNRVHFYFYSEFLKVVVLVYTIYILTLAVNLEHHAKCFQLGPKTLDGIAI